jgi:aquaporin Z
MGFATTLRRHWPEYLIEAFLLGAFMVSALGMTVLLEHPASRAHAALPDPTLRRALMGCAMGDRDRAGLFALGPTLEARFNPAFTLAFLRLGKIRPADAHSAMWPRSSRAASPACSRSRPRSACPSRHRA